MNNTRCRPFEIEVFAKMLEHKIPSENIRKIISDAVVTNYEPSSNGYLLELTNENIDLTNELIHNPVIVGKYGPWQVDFILFTEKYTITMDCCSSDLTGLPENIRDLEIELTTESPVELLN